MAIKFVIPLGLLKPGMSIFIDATDGRWKYKDDQGGVHPLPVPTETPPSDEELSDNGTPAGTTDRTEQRQ